MFANIDIDDKCHCYIFSNSNCLSQIISEQAIFDLQTLFFWTFSSEPSLKGSEMLLRRTEMLQWHIVLVAILRDSNKTWWQSVEKMKKNTTHWSSVWRCWTYVLVGTNHIWFYVVGSHVMQALDMKYTSNILKRFGLSEFLHNGRASRDVSRPQSNTLIPCPSEYLVRGCCDKDDEFRLRQTWKFSDVGRMLDVICHRSAVLQTKGLSPWKHDGAPPKCHTAGRRTNPSTGAVSEPNPPCFQLRFTQPV